MLISQVLRHENAYFNTYYWFRVVCIHLIPCTTLVAVNAALVNAMRRASRRRRQLLSYAVGAGPRRRSECRTQETGRKRTECRLGRSECRRLADSNVTTAMLVVVVGVFLVVEFPLAVLFVVVIVQNSVHVEIIGAELGDTASVFINLLILLSYSTNFFIYCAMSAQFRAALFETFSRRRRESLSTTAGEGGGSRAGRRSTGLSSMMPGTRMTVSTAAGSMMPGNAPAAKPVSLAMSMIDNDRRTGTRLRTVNLYHGLEDLENVSLDPKQCFKHLAHEEALRMFS